MPESTTTAAPPAPSPTPHGRAGRDLRLAIPVGAGLIALVAASLFLRIEAFAVLVGLACLMAEWELVTAFAHKHIRVPIAPLWVGSVGMSVSAWIGGPVALTAALMLTAGTIFVWRALDGGGEAAMRMWRAVSASPPTSPSWPASRSSWPTMRRVPSWSPPTS